MMGREFESILFPEFETANSELLDTYRYMHYIKQYYREIRCFRSKSTKIMNFRKLTECFVKYFMAVQFEGQKGHLGSFLLAIFLKPNGTRCKKVLQNFCFTVVLLDITY